MTLIFGIFSANGQSDCVTSINEMMQSLSHVAADATNIWNTGLVALGQNTVRISPESLLDNLPLYQESTRLTITGSVRLDNRGELLSALGFLGGGKDYGDAHIVLEAYRKWGERCPEHLIGDFSFVIWDENKQELFCCVDHFASRSIYYFYDGRRFIFSSTPNEIMAVTGVPAKINQQKLSTLVYKDVNPLFRGESWFEDIFPMPAATTFIVSKGGIKKRKYWEPQIGTELSFANEAEFAEAFQEVIFRAVGDRMNSLYPVTALLSGGLDSSAIVAVAARILEKQNRELNVFSAVLPNPSDPILTDERFFIDQFKAFPNVKINYITAPERGFFSGLEELKTTILGPNLISRHFLYTAFAERASALGSRVILDGGGGEFGPTFHGSGCYSELFLNLKWIKLWQEVNSRKKLVNESPIRNILDHVIKPLVPDLVMRYLHKQPGYLERTREHCIQESFLQTLRPQLESRTKGLTTPSRRDSPFHRVNQVRLLQVKQSKAHGVADLGDIELRYPLMDKRLLEFCLAAPLHFKVKDGYHRYLVRAGLNKILPPAIQWRNSKGAFSADYNRRYREQLPHVRQFLAEIAPNDPVRQIVDIEKLKNLTHIPVTDAEFNTFAEKAARDFVPQGVYLIQFLRRFNEFQI